jgi:hypothetical protein
MPGQPNQLSFIGAATTDRWWYWSWPLARLTMTPDAATIEPAWRILAWLFCPKVLTWGAVERVVRLPTGVKFVTKTGATPMRFYSEGLDPDVILDAAESFGATVDRG